MAGYYRQYIDHFTDRMEALNERIRAKRFEWNEAEAMAFQNVKNAYKENQILILGNPEKQAWVHADASNYAIGLVISQEDDQGRRRPVLFYSRKLLPPEMNYTTSDKEMLAIVQTLKKFRHLLQGTKYPVIIKSDHKNLRTFMTTKELNARQARWAEELSSYDFRIEHIKGKENRVADALSRRVGYKEDETPERKTQMLVEKDGALIINRQMKLSMISLNFEDKELIKEIKEATQKSERVDIETEEDGFRRFNGLIFIPKEMEEKLIQRHHDEAREGHPGIARTMEKIQRGYYFPGMHRKVAKYIGKCNSCARNKNEYRKPQGEMVTEEAPKRPWEKITADFLEMPPTQHALWTDVLDELLVVVDSFSKFTILIPTKKTATTEEILLLWERVFAVFGIPQQMLSNRDRIFKTEKWRQLMEDINVIRMLATAYHQRTDGQTERKIQELRAYFRHYLDYGQKNWIELTPIAQYAVNDAKNATTGKTPNFLVFGTRRIMGEEIRSEEHGIPFQKRMEEIHNEAKLDIE
jgi:hypothetical protein